MATGGDLDELELPTGDTKHENSKEQSTEKRSGSLKDAWKESKTVEVKEVDPNSEIKTKTSDQGTSANSQGTTPSSSGLQTANSLGTSAGTSVMATGGDVDESALPTGGTENENPNEQSTERRSGSPKKDSNKHETVEVKEGRRVTFKCIMGPNPEIETGKENDDGDTYHYTVTSSDKSKLSIKWFPENHRSEITEAITIQRASMKHHETIFTAQICRKNSKNKDCIEETKTWELRVKVMATGDGDELALPTGGTENENPNEQSTERRSGSPKKASNETETVEVEKGRRVTFKCIMDNDNAEIETRKENDDGVTFHYTVTSSGKSKPSIKWFPENHRSDQITEAITIDSASMKHDGTIFTAQICRKNSKDKEFIEETKTWKLSVKDELWDVHEISDEEWKGVDYHEEDWTDSANFIIRILLHFLLFFIIIACFFESKVSLHILLSLLGNENMQNSEMANTRGIIILYLFLILAVPDFMTICLYLLRWLFGKHDHPGKKMQRERNFVFDKNKENNTPENKKPTVKCIIVCYVVTELVQCIGVIAWIFFVCPYLSTVEMYVVPVAFVWPGVFRYITKKIRKKIKDRANLFIYVIFDAIQIVITFSILSLITYFKTDKLRPWDVALMWISTVLVPIRWIRHYIDFNDDDMDHNYSYFRLVVPIIRVFISTGFVLIYLLIVQQVPIPLLLIGFPFPIEQNPEVTFNWTSYYTSGCTSGVFEYIIITNPENASLHYFIFELFLTHLIASCLLYYFAVLACRICMQRVCFFVPLMIAGVVYQLILHGHFLWRKDGVNCQLYLHEKVLIGLFYGSFLCQLFLMNNICEKQTEVMPFKKSLFTLPHYCSPIADISLLHSRRIIDTGDDVNKKTDKKDKDEQTNVKKPTQTANRVKSKDTGDVNTDKKEHSKPTNSNSPPGNTKSTSPQNNSRDVNSSNQNTSEPIDHTKLYICATMWHETMKEMKNLIFSILRLDYDHSLTSNSRRIKGYEAEKGEKFEFEGHIFFDDAFKNNKQNTENVSERNEQSKKKKVNDYVHQFENALNQAVSEFYSSAVKINKPKFFFTLYGKRLEWKLPGNNNSLFVHLKDKDKIRHKKRWSQVMYLYYLLGYKLLLCNASDIDATKIARQEIPVKNDNISKKIENTFVLSLDGDVKFYPMAIKRLLARMKKNPSVAASSGRIVPSGSGPVVWYQKFEYAVGHWLQKTTEHKFGCVLCSPGCFTLFRAKSLLSGNIMRNYTKISTKPRERVQYDQGEDRWLCTLLLKEGFRVEYFAAAQAKTFVPEEFEALFKQRKRWIPSTISNICDIIQNRKQIQKNNQNISFLYIVYQCILLAATVLGPSTILLAMDAALRVVFGFQSWHVYLFVYGPPVFYIYLCLKVNEGLQRTIGVVLSLAYSLLMLSVFIGTVVNIVQEGWYTPSAVFLYVLFGVFILAGVMHVHEIGNLLHIFTYFILLPLGFLFIPIYAICNMNDISWGTRENQTAESSNPDNTESDQEPFNNNRLIEETNKYILEKNKNSSSNSIILNIFHMSYYLLQLKLFEAVGKLENPTRQPDTSTNNEEEDQDSANIDRDGVYSVEYEEEKPFWVGFIKKYLDPNPEDKKTVTKKQKQKQEQEDLDKFRNKMASRFFFFNAVWIVVVSSMNEVKHELNIMLNIADNHVLIEPLGFLFLVIFALLLIMQVTGMTLHRYSTFLHVMAATDNRRKTFNQSLKIKKNVEILLSPTKEGENITDKKLKEKPIEMEVLQKAVNRYQGKDTNNTTTNAEERSGCFSFCGNKRNKVDNSEQNGGTVTPENGTGQTSDNQQLTTPYSNSSIHQKKFNLTKIFNQRIMHFVPNDDIRSGQSD